MAGMAEGVDIDGAQICVRRSGAGAPLLLLGDMLGPTGWAAYMDLLAAHFQVVAPEHPGFGGAKIPPWLDTVSDLANFYFDFLDQQRLVGDYWVVHEFAQHFVFAAEEDIGLPRAPHMNSGCVDKRDRSKTQTVAHRHSMRGSNLTSPTALTGGPERQS